MQLPILSGIYQDAAANLRTAYPTNLMPVPLASGISQGVLRTHDGIRTYAPTTFNTAFGPDRGGFLYKGKLYRLAGQQFYRVDDNGDGTGTTTVLRTFLLGDQASFDQSFDRLIICVSGQIWYYDDATNTFTQITDPDLGTPVDALFLDGYTVFTDGTFIGVTELNDRLSVLPLRYGSSEVDPDPIVALLKLRNELHALNRYTIEVLDNIGGTGFPFQRIDAAMIPKGCVGTHACAVFMEAIAFLGGGRNDPPSVYIGGGGQAVEIADAEVQRKLKLYTEAQLAATILEVRADEQQQLLYVHLPDLCMVYDGNASKVAGKPVWFYLSSGAEGTGLFRGRNFIWAYNKWICGDVSDGQQIGVLDDRVASHFGNAIGYEFSTQGVYNEGRGGIFNALELVATTGAAIGTAEDNVQQTVRHSYSKDGKTFSTERPRLMGKAGQTTKRIVWRPAGSFENWRTDRFRGLTSVPVSFVRAEADIEPLAD
jgi:hypothetical protein